jgi:hypothetical protein
MCYPSSAREIGVMEPGAALSSEESPPPRQRQVRREGLGGTITIMRDDSHLGA